MSVSKWRRTLSKTEFIKELLELNTRCGQIVANKPRKYKDSYGDFLIKQCLKALELAHRANSIYLTANTSEEEMNRRILMFTQVIEICTNIPAVALIYLELVKRSDGYKNDCIKDEDFFGDKCDKIVNLIKATIKSDKQRYKAYKNKNKI